MSLVDKKLEKAYVLHARGFQESSLLINLFSENKGIISVIAKGAKRPRSRWRGILQPFVKLDVHCSGKSELQTLTEAEAEVSAPQLIGKISFYGFYINELLLRLFNMQESNTQIFDLYSTLLSKLENISEPQMAEACLRIFEYQSLEILGYGIDLSLDVNNNNIEPDIVYQYDEGMGLIETSVLPQSDNIAAISGASLLALHNGIFENEAQLKEAKLIMRARLRPHIGEKPFQSRLLFKKLTAKES
jgi:DNA repair protein RecO (recombination protein O)